jgi:hypothetical protein
MFMARKTQSIFMVGYAAAAKKRIRDPAKSSGHTQTGS